MTLSGFREILACMLLIFLTLIMLLVFLDFLSYHWPIYSGIIVKVKEKTSFF